MADLPIPFTGPMVRALLREIEAPGTGKTQTRRLAVPLVQPFQSRDILIPGAPSGGFRPRYAVGDRLYVREHWRCAARWDDTAPRDLLPRSMTIAFDAGGSIANQDSRDDWRPSSASYTEAEWMGRFRQGMHLPRWASRITLLVTEVRVQRLQEISAADACDEGVRLDHTAAHTPPVTPWYVPGSDCAGASPVAAYAALWDQINGPGAWAANPWVVAYTFRPILGNIDKIAA